MGSGTVITPDLAAIPAYLTGLSRELRGGKKTKVPKTPWNKAASSTDSQTWHHSRRSLMLSGTERGHLMASALCSAI
jgi:hypothetical protein